MKLGFSVWEKNMLRVLIFGTTKDQKDEVT
jgi:hypothetical protein